jgi:pimeloyl-ACP methyl ester carboxylesterase
MSVEFTTTLVHVGDTPVTVLRGGSGRPVLVLHDELGFPGWMTWNRQLARDYELIIPLQPGFGVTPRVEWFRTYRDVADFYSRLTRELGLASLAVMGFSAGGFIAAEMAVACPGALTKLVLVGPLGVKPDEGEIADVLAMTVRSHVALTVSRTDAPEFGEIFGGEMTPDQFELFEAARAETSRLGWEPFLHSPSLIHRLAGLAGLPTTVIWGTDDLVIPDSCADQYQRAIPHATVIRLPGLGHRPEIEDPSAFVAVVSIALSESAIPEGLAVR